MHREIMLKWVHWEWNFLRQLINAIQHSTTKYLCQCCRLMHTNNLVIRFYRVTVTEMLQPLGCGGNRDSKITRGDFGQTNFLWKMMSRESREIDVRAVVKLNVETKQYNLLKRTLLSKLALSFPVKKPTCVTWPKQNSRPRINRQQNNKNSSSWQFTV